MKLDPILLEIMNAKLSAIAGEMAAHLQRASRSMYVKEAADFGVGIVDVEGRMFAYPPGANRFSIDRPCGHSICAVPDIEAGDVIVTNDPYTSDGLSTHLPDLHMLRPVFHKGRIVCYGWAFIHFTDVGGRVPSSISPSNHEIFQEGIIVPPMKILRRGVINHDFVTVFTANCRTPDINMGDIGALLGALETCEKRVLDVVAVHGAETVIAAESDLQDYSAAKARAVLRRIPDGEYEFWDYLDDDMASRIPVRIRVKMTVKDGTVHLDFTNTDPQVAASFNVPTMNRLSYWLSMRLTTFICSHDKSVPLNAGMYRPITCTNPRGTILNAEFPDAVGIRSAAAMRLQDAITGCILKAAPGLMAGPTCGANVPLVLSELDDSGTKRNVQVIQPMRGGMAAARGVEGVDARDVTINNMNNHPLESVEADAGVIIRNYDICTDSGGAGEWRGGVGQQITVEIVRDGGKVLARGMERQRFRSWGTMGGKPSQPLRVIFNKGQADELTLAKIDELTVKAGDTLTIYMPGGPGYGDPYRRSPEKVGRDVVLGFVSRGAAKSDYGVVIGDDGRVDVATTRRIRAARVHGKVHTDFDFGPEREAWDAAFDDDLMTAFNRKLYALPKSVRGERRRRIFEAAIPDLPPSGDPRFLKVVMDPDAIRTRFVAAIDRLLG
jgi:N-methylhydantoinase B